MPNPWRVPSSTSGSSGTDTGQQGTASAPPEHRGRQTLMPVAPKSSLTPLPAHPSLPATGVSFLIRPFPSIKTLRMMRKFRKDLRQCATSSDDIYIFNFLNLFRSVDFCSRTVDTHAQPDKLLSNPEKKLPGQKESPCPTPFPVKILPPHLEPPS